MFCAAREAQILAGRVAVSCVPPPVDVRAVLCEAIPPAANDVERYVLEGLIAVGQQALRKSLSRLPASDTLAGRAASILRDRYAEPWTIPRLVHELATNHFRLTTEFKTAFGVGLHEYLVRCRVQAAEDRIRAGEKIETTAYGVGFRSKKTLYGAFRRIRGRLPATSRLKERDG
jgi:AraC-like DNA-binding protein